MSFKSACITSILFLQNNWRVILIIVKAIYDREGIAMCFCKPDLNSMFIKYREIHSEDHYAQKSLDYQEWARYVDIVAKFNKPKSFLTLDGVVLHKIIQLELAADKKAALKELERCSPSDFNIESTPLSIDDVVSDKVAQSAGDKL
jgi:hypothetical protein